ncbi:sugar kinase [Altererythrobacter aquiaggeris]|uniref:sugar kinase n=1 Tax=Aestuarierythrobacter aquiaggeris TaxID=1898396 RepID=UPI00301A3588
MTTFIFGEAMLEYHSHGGTGLGYGGDTLNTAVHLARAGHDVAYVTAVGTDPISDALVAAWSKEGIDTRYVLRHPERNPGIYAIHLDDHGERSFLYWRDHSAAREMFSLPGIAEAMAAAEQATLVYYSLITLAIIDDNGRGKLLRLSERRRNSGKAVAYDSNFRPALWPDLSEARHASRLAMSHCSIGLPTNNDECELWSHSEDEFKIASGWVETGCDIVAVKAAEKGCVLADRQSEIQRLFPAIPTEVIDSSGAGDAFNGGFLGAWLLNEPVESCVEAGQAKARETLAHRGAII